jgi:hypothetical protein
MEIQKKKIIKIQNYEIFFERESAAASQLS